MSLHIPEEDINLEKSSVKDAANHVKFLATKYPDECRYYINYLSTSQMNVVMMPGYCLEAFVDVDGNITTFEKLKEVLNSKTGNIPITNDKMKDWIKYAVKGLHAFIDKEPVQALVRLRKTNPDEFEQIIINRLSADEDRLSLQVILNMITPDVPLIPPQDTIYSCLELMHEVPERFTDLSIQDLREALQNGFEKIFQQ